MGRFDDQSDARSFAYLLINDGFKHIRLNDFTNDAYTGSLILGMPSEKELEKA